MNPAIRAVATFAIATAALLAFSANVEATKGPSCYHNPNPNHSLYVSVRWPNGNSNFVLPPGGAHRLNDMDDTDTYVCVDGNPIPADACPHRQPVPLNNCKGNE